MSRSAKVFLAPYRPCVQRQYHSSSPDPNSLRPTVSVLLEKEILKDLAVTVSYLGLRRVKVASAGLLPGAINQPKIYRTGELQEFSSLH